MTSRPELPTLQFPDDAAWERWLEENHDSSPGIWMRIAKKSSRHTSARYPEVLDAALCFGWIDGQRAPQDEDYFLQRFTPRGARSRWSQINREKAERLSTQGRMRPAGLAEIEAAKEDGRWEAAYAPQSTATVPEDFQRALDGNPKANAFFQTLRGQNRYSFIYRINDAKRPETRARRIETFVKMLADGETFYP